MICERLKEQDFEGALNELAELGDEAAHSGGDAAAAYHDLRMLTRYALRRIAIVCLMLLCGCSSTSVTQGYAPDASGVAGTGGALSVLSVPSGGAASAPEAGTAPAPIGGAPAADAGPCEPATLINWQCGAPEGPTLGALSGFEESNPGENVWTCVSVGKTIEPPNPEFGQHQGDCAARGFLAVCFHC